MRYLVVCVGLQQDLHIFDALLDREDGALDVDLCRPDLAQLDTRVAEGGVRVAHNLRAEAHKVRVGSQRVYLCVRACRYLDNFRNFKLF